MINEIPDMNEKLVFIISSPRSGSTLLERMISSHPAVLGGPEPHLLTPLAHLGYYETVEKAPYDHLRAVPAQREYVASLPNQETDYLDALRAYCNILYGRRLLPSGKKLLLDKTPAYALVLPFIAKVYPNAKYVVLTRHPGAIFSSYAESFFEGDWNAAHAFNPIVERYVPAIARFVRETDVPKIHIRYEELVKEPEKCMMDVCQLLGVDYTQDMIEYGKHQHQDKGLGDPVGVKQHQRPVTGSIAKWATTVAQDPEKEALLRKMIGNCDPRDLSTWGFSQQKLFEPLEKAAASVTSNATPPKKKRDPMTIFKMQRIILHILRRNIHHNWLGKIVKKVRFTCDVLLR